MLFRVASILVACTASEAIAPERILKRKLAKTPGWLNKFVEFTDKHVPLNLEGQKLIGKMKELGGAGNMVPKVVAVTVGISILLEPVLYILDLVLARLKWGTAAEPLMTSKIFMHLQNTCNQATFWLLAIMNGVGIWKIESNRVNYGIMFTALLVSYVYSALEYRRNWYMTEKGIFRSLLEASSKLNHLVEAIALSTFWVVALFNFTKVLLPVFSKWVDSMQKKLK